MAELDWQLRWRANIWRTLAWLRAPADEEDHASFQLDVVWEDGVERLPEVYALETSNRLFEVAWPRLESALTSRRSVLAVPARKVRSDGKVLVHSVVVRAVPPQLLKRDEYDPNDRYNHPAPRVRQTR
jgi:hypothetical protein